MAQTAQHLTDHVRRLTVRQCVLSVPKRLRYFLQFDGAGLNTALRIFLRVIEQSLHRHCPGAAQLAKTSPRIDVVAFIHRYGSSLNTHVHFHVCAADGVLETLASNTHADRATPPVVLVHLATGLDEAPVAPIQPTCCIDRLNSSCFGVIGWKIKKPRYFT